MSNLLFLGKPRAKAFGQWRKSVVVDGQPMMNSRLSLWRIAVEAELREFIVRSAMTVKPAPFSLHGSEEDIADLHSRLARTRFPDQAPGDAWRFGTDVGYLRTLIEYWQSGFDWRAEEARLNAFLQFSVELHGINCPADRRVYFRPHA